MVIFHSFLYVYQRVVIIHRDVSLALGSSVRCQSLWRSQVGGAAEKVDTGKPWLFMCKKKHPNLGYLGASSNFLEREILGYVWQCVDGGFWYCHYLYIKIMKLVADIVWGAARWKCPLCVFAAEGVAWNARLAVKHSVDECLTGA